MTQDRDGTVDPTFVSSDEPAEDVDIDALLEPGTQVGEYVVEFVLGRGAYGTVYRGVHPVIGKQVAIKVLSLRYSVDPRIVSRFVSEARAVNQIRHENIIDIFSFGALEDRRRYYVMEYIDGLPLDVHLERVGQLDVDEALSILSPIASALDAAHASGIAHRDLKPANVFLGKKSDGTWFPKLLDFGIAKLMGDDLPKNHQTATGAAVGTPHYMSPEQCMGGDVDHRADIYAFGVLTFRMLTGRLPFEANNTLEILVQHMQKEPPAPRSIRPDLDVAVEQIILQMLQKSREARPSQLGPVVTAVINLDATISGADIVAVPPAEPVVERTNPALMSSAQLTLSGDIAVTPRPRPVGAIVVALFGLLVAIGVGWALIGRSTAPPAMVTALPKPAPSKTITLKIEGVPANTTVRTADGAQLGSAAAPLRIDRSEEVLELVVSAEGFAEARVTIVPNDDKSVVIAMVEDKAPVDPEPKAGSRKVRRKRRTRTNKTKRAVDADAMDTWD